MKQIFSISNLVNFSARRPVLTVFIWFVIAALSIFGTGAWLNNALTTEQDFTNTPDSKRASNLIEEHFPERSQSAEFVIVDSIKTIDDPVYQAFVGELKSKIQALGPEHVTNVITVFETEQPALVSKDKTATLIPVTLSGEINGQEASAEKLKEVAHSAQTEGFKIYVFGAATVSADFQKVSEADLQKGELFGLPVAMIILIAVFAAVVAALVPIVLSIVAILAAIGLVATIGRVHDFSFFVVNMITMMGLAVGIDYSLFIISRYREERAQGNSKLKAIDIAGSTASRAVVFSGLTVVLALCGMLFVPMNVFQGLATGAIFVVFFSVLTSLTLLPAVLSLLGDRINWLSIGKPRSYQPGEKGFWNMVTRNVMRKPVVSLIIVVAILLAAAVPVLDLKTGASGIGSMPDTLESKQSFNIVKEKFSPGLLSPVLIAIEGSINDQAVSQAVEAIERGLITDSQFGFAQHRVSDNQKVVLIAAPIASEATSEQAFEAIQRLRDEIIPTALSGAAIGVYVGGESAGNLDFVDIARDYTFVVFGFVLTLSFILLTMVFHSIVVPIKAILMNLLSVAAAYGLVVLVSQKGVGAELLGFQQVETIEAWIPLFLFTVLFGLSMDYHVFLLSRIKEQFNKTGNNDEAVSYGVRTTASIITGAALIMVAVFGSFAAGDLVMFQQMGFGLAVAVLLDATIVRSILVPASMKLLGTRNWYLPRWLRWLPNLEIERNHTVRKIT